MSRPIHVPFCTNLFGAVRRQATVAASLFIGIAIELTAVNAAAQNGGRGEIAPPQVEESAPANGVASKATHTHKPYYIEFRARNAESYGHTFSIFGRLDERGNIVSKTVAGLHPFTESSIPWVIGHVVMVPSETGASDGDVEDQYTIARMRVELSAAEYKTVTNFIADLQQRSPVWHAVFFNCNAFVGVIARFMGLQTPSSLKLPEDYINGIRESNEGRPKAGIIGTLVKVEDAETLRKRAYKIIDRKKRLAGAASH